MTRAVKTLLSLLVAFAAVRAAAQDAGAPPSPEQLAARERIRPQVEAIFREMREPWKPGEDHPHFFGEVTDRLIALGPDVVPFLVGELDLMDPQSYHYCAYALGRLGGSDAESALRKAVRRSDERGGRFGEACKRYAVFGLAVMGKPDVVDLVQAGVPVQSLEQFPDLPLMAHVAALAAPGDIPLLVKQLDAYAATATAPGADKTTTDKLYWTLAGLIRVGDASLVPKVLPILASPVPGLRAQAVDFLSRYGPPEICSKLIPNLDDTTGWYQFEVGAAIERMKARPCYDQLVARVEVEPDPVVRGLLLRTIAAIAGDASLEVLRTAFERGGTDQRRDVVDALGSIGSVKGLNLVRAGLTEPSIDTVMTSVEALARIGGPGALDTLLALVSDPRRVVSLGAVRKLVALDERRAGPRVAERLLALVREPVGDLTLRPAVAEMSDALVSLDFAEPAADLAAAAAVQSDPEIRAQLTTCARLLTILRSKGDDADAWTAALADPDVAVRALAARRLAEIDTPPCARALTARFDAASTPDEDRAAILRAIGDARSRLCASLVERGLGDAAFDVWTRARVRDEAAWAARRIGGERMIEALRASAIRRDGQDWSTLVYLALADPRGAAATLRPLRTARLRYAVPRFGHEDGDLDEILGDLAAKVVPRRYDVPPEILATDL